ncbi:MAG: hypothetical protein ACLR56_12230 [Oscillospiraceae bacterium]
MPINANGKTDRKWLTANYKISDRGVILNGAGYKILEEIKPGVDYSVETDLYRG